MDKEVTQFISDIINLPSATSADRERIVSLLLKEYDGRFVTKEQLEERINFIRLKDGKINVGSKPLHKPKQTYCFLSLFNDGKWLKYLTHPFNDGFIEYDSFMHQCKEEFDKAKEQYPYVPDSLMQRITHFAFEKAPNWFIRDGGDEKKYINMGWSEPSFAEWYKKNRTHPKNDAFYYNEMIMPFKESIQVRSDTGNLIRLINRTADLVFGKQRCCEVDISESVVNAQFYTNVDNLGLALYHIFDTIKDYSEKNFHNKVRIEYSTEDDNKVLSIIHLDSEPTKRADDKDYLSGDSKTIKNALWGLCNYEIMANFPDGAYKMIVLSDNEHYVEKQLVSVDKQQVKGYTHILKFY